MRRLLVVMGLPALMLSGHVAAQQVSGRKLMPKHPQASNAFHVDAASTLGIPSAAGSGLNLDSVSAWNTEEITVYAKRHIVRPPSNAPGPITLGSVAISGASKTDQIGFSGVTVTAALPIPGVPGLDAVANLSGGHDAVTSSTTRESAALTAGFRLKF